MLWPCTNESYFLYLKDCKQFFPVASKLLEKMNIFKAFHSHGQKFQIIIFLKFVKAKYMFYIFSLFITST